MKVIFIAPRANVPEELLRKLKKHASIYFFENDPIDIREIKLLKEKGDKILCPFPEPMNWEFPNDFIPQIPDLKAICLSTTSFDWIDGKLCRILGVDLTNAPNQPNGVAEAAIFMMLALARKYPVVTRQKKFEFIPTNYLYEVKGKTMGIIGLGKIGTRIAQLGKELGMKVVYWSRSQKKTDLEPVELKKLLKTADFIFPCVALSEETKNFISKKEIDLMKPTAAVISVAKKGVADIEYLVKKVEKGEMFGVAFESNEKKLSDFKGNIFVTPQVNWYTKETVEAKMKLWIESVISVIKGKPINVVNN